VYGAWNAMKNKGGKDEHANAKLEWVAYIGGTRESRQLIGDIVLTREDIDQKKPFPDGTVPTTWDIDLHYPKEQFAKKFADDPFISRAEFGAGVVTSLARLGGHPVAIAATNPRHLGGAIDVAGCDKLARFMQLADAAGWPLVTLVDTPGFMVGPAVEAQGMMRHAGRLFVNAASLRVPVASVVLRRGFGLGAMAMTAGHFHAPVATAACPAAEFGAMGLEGAVRLGFRKELAAAPEGERGALFERLLALSRERGQALNMAAHLEIDDVIDPAETRAWLIRVLAVARTRPLAPRRPFVDTW
jgi:acetyl-CoA carboxylase carboxyltransferase component